jgi:para-nitrobenzyl esterase
MTEKDRDVSDQMIAYLVNFCRSGDPNGEGLTVWHPAGKKQPNVLCIGEKQTRMGNPNMLKLVKIMLTNEAPGE